MMPMQRKPGCPVQRKKFENYHGIERSAIRKADVLLDKSLEKLYGRFASDARNHFSATFFTSKGSDEDYYFSKALRLIGRTRYSPRDIEKFAVSLAGFSEDNKLFEIRMLGLFISALVEKGDGKDFKIPVFGAGHCLGYRNSRDIMLSAGRGDYLEDIGTFMKSGSIHGEAESIVCCGQRMSGGEMILKAKLFTQVGSDMKGGTLVVYGEVDKFTPIGSGMSGGEIYIFGPSPYFENRTSNARHGGRIFYNGIQVFPT